MSKGSTDKEYYEKQNARLLEVLEQALATPRGISVSSIDAHELRRNLSILRKKLRDKGDNRFDNLRISSGPPGSDEVFLLHKE